MITLFISTFNSIITIGLLKNKELISKIEKESNKSHSILLIPMIDEILKNSKLAPNDLNEIIVVNGPGSFTGVRLGVTVAKTLAYTLKINIKTITSIEAMALSTDDQNKIITLSDSKGKYIGVFENNKLINDIKYISNTDYAKFIESYAYPIYEELSMDIKKICLYLENVKSTNPHKVNPVYIKTIEALNGR